MAPRSKVINLPSLRSTRGKKSSDTPESEQLWVEKQKLGGVDASFLLLVVLLLLFGLVMMYSSSYAAGTAQMGDAMFFIKKQAQFAGIGLACMVGTIFIPLKFYQKFALPILVVGFLGLVAVLFIGRSVGGAQRWIFIGPINFQPSEIAKLSLVIFMAAYIASMKSKMQNLVYGVLIPLGILALFAGLMLLEPHLSGTVIMAATVAIMIFIGGAKVSHTIVPAAIGGGGLALFAILTGYAKDRLDMFLNPWIDPRGKGYQIIQSLYAIGSGGFLGLGLGQSRQKYSYIPEPYNDFVFSIIAEEIGFVGVLLLIALFCALIFRGFQIAWRVKKHFSSLLVIGIMCNVAVQILLNIAVVSKLVPVTGISLPFFSAGGSSLIILLVEMGIVLSVSRHMQ